MERPTIMEVDLNAFEYNVSQIQSLVGDNVKLMPVIKANGYGTYINTRTDIINKFDIVAVALSAEGIVLRKLGYEKEILVLNQPSISEAKEIIENDITIGLSSQEFLDYLIENYKRAKIHIEIETGMNRTGINLENIDTFLDKLKDKPNIELQGIYTHLSSADIDDEYTKLQIERFEKALNKTKEKFENIKYIHVSASNGILNYPNSYYNTVRPGIILYGYEPYEGAKYKINLKPVCKLKSKITFIKEVLENTPIGYSKAFITNRKSKIATIPIGYADGFRRGYGKNGFVVINNQKAPIVGNVCMDGFMVDVTDLPDVKLGDTVYIWDNENILVEELEKKVDTINYEVISTISNRVPRIFSK